MYVSIIIILQINVTSKIIDISILSPRGMQFQHWWCYLFLFLVQNPYWHFLLTLPMLSTSTPFNTTQLTPWSRRHLTEHLQHLVQISMTQEPGFNVVSTSFFLSHFGKDLTTTITCIPSKESHPFHQNKVSCLFAFDHRFEEQ